MTGEVTVRVATLEEFYEERKDLWHCTMEDRAASDEFNRRLWHVVDVAGSISSSVELRCAIDALGLQAQP